MAAKEVASQGVGENRGTEEYREIYTSFAFVFSLYRPQTPPSGRSISRRTTTATISKMFAAFEPNIIRYYLKNDDVMQKQALASSSELSPGFEMFAFTSVFCPLLPP